MANSRQSAAEFAEAWNNHGGSAPAVAKEFGIDLRGVFARRRRLEEAGIVLVMPANAQLDFSRRAYATTLQHSISDGCAVIFSDAHWGWHTGATPAESALLAVLAIVRPQLVIANGDVLDGASVSRHAPLGWERRPSITDEVADMQEGMSRVAAASGGARLMRTVGNHDRRFDYHLAVNASNYRGLTGYRLSDHLPDWAESWTVRLNKDQCGGDVMVKHQLAGGIHAAYNNAVKAGITIVTGHTHKLNVRPITDYRGRRWGVECGTLAATGSPAFEYAEAGADPGCGGFAVLTWLAGVLQPPELCELDEAGVAWFRGAAVRPRVRVKAVCVPA